MRLNPHAVRAESASYIAELLHAGDFRAALEAGFKVVHGDVDDPERAPIFDGWVATCVPELNQDTEERVRLGVNALRRLVADRQRLAIEARVYRRTGRLFASKPLTAGERAIADAAFAQCRGGFPLRSCYSNARRLVRADATGALVYCEGVSNVTLSGSLLPHGFASIHGKVVDPRSMATEAPVFGVLCQGLTYFGRELSPEEARRDKAGKLHRRRYVQSTDYFVWAELGRRMPRTAATEP